MNSDYKVIEQKDEKGSTKEIKVEIGIQRLNEAVETTYQRLSKNIVIPGFREGKAPRNMIEAKLGASLYEEALNVLIPQVANEVLTELNLYPLDTPHFHIEKFDLKAPLVFMMHFAIYPKVTIKESWKDIKVTKGKLTKEEEETLNESQKKEKLDEIETNYYNELMRQTIKHMQADIPSIMVDRETQNREKTYTDRIASLGLNLNDFLQSKNTTLDDLKKEWESESRFYVQQELFLNQFAQDNGIEISKEEIDEEIKKLDPKIQEQFNNDYSREYIKYLLRKQKSYHKLLETIGKE